MEPLAARRRRLGRERRRPPRCALVIWAGLRFLSGDYQFLNAGARRLPTGCAWRACRSTTRTQHPGGNPFPIPPLRSAEFPAFSSYGTMDPDTTPHGFRPGTPRSSSRSGRLGRGELSRQLLGSAVGPVALNPGVSGLGACTINGVSYPVCTTAANLDSGACCTRRTRGSAVARPRRSPHRLDAGYHGAEAVGPPPRRERREPQRQLHAAHCVGNVTPPARRSAPAT